MIAAGQRWFVEYKLHTDMPVTKQDIEHINENPEYVECDKVPRITNLVVRRVHGRNQVRADWDYEGGCVESITVHSYKSCWKARGIPRCDETTAKAYDYEITPWIQVGDEITLESIQVRPNDVVMGASHYHFHDKTLRRTVIYR